MSLKPLKLGCGITNILETNCAIVDTWWQTETGSIMISPLPGVTETKPGSTCGPLPGNDSIIIDNDDDRGKWRRRF